MTGIADVELYWIPGCSSCLRMKEFVESRGVPFTSINVVEDPQRGKRLYELGALTAPVVAVGDEWVSGGDLDAVARLLDLADYEHRALPATELRARYHAIMTTLCGLVRQATPEALRSTPGHWDWTLIDIAHHAASVMRVFLIDYDAAAYTGAPYRMDYEENRAPSGITTAEQLVDHAVDTLMHFNHWWAERGWCDPLERVVSTYWGDQDLHACLEREVWHTAQHTRQVEALLRDAGVDVLAPLTGADLAGLPLPERLYS